jgi:hypothetical protein
LVVLGGVEDELAEQFAGGGWQQPDGHHRHPDAAVLRDLAVMLADGGDCLSDLAVLRDQPALFGPGGLHADRLAGRRAGRH